jgi:hypothetical protein
MMQDVYDQLVAREKKVRKAEQDLAEAEAEGLRRLRAREDELEVTLRAREARLSQQVCITQTR